MSYTYTQLKSSIQEYTDNNETSFISNLNRFIESAEQRIFSTVDLEYFRKNASGAMTLGNQFLAVPTDYLASFSMSIENSGSKVFLLQKDVNFLQESYPDITVTGIPKYYAAYDVNNFIIAPVPNASFSTELHYYYRPTSLTDSKFTLSVNGVTASSSHISFVQGETITGGTSGESTIISVITSGTQVQSLELIVPIPTGTFTVGETITGGTSGVTAVVVSTSEDTTLTWVSENAPNALLYGSLFEAYTYMKGERDMLDLYNGRFSEALGRIKDLAEARENTDAYRKGLPSRART